MKKQFEQFAKKIRPVYKLLNWGWWDKGVPKEKDIVDVLTELMDNLKERPESEEISTGGLFVRRDKESESIYYGFVNEERLKQ